MIVVLASSVPRVIRSSVASLLSCDWNRATLMIIGWPTICLLCRASFDNDVKPDGSSDRVYWKSFCIRTEVTFHFTSCYLPPVFCRAVIVVASMLITSLLSSVNIRIACSMCHQYCQRPGTMVMKPQFEKFGLLPFWKAATSPKLNWDLRRRVMPPGKQLEMKARAALQCPRR